MAMTREQVIEKAKKLMSLGESDNAHEAALAVARAQELLHRYEIEMADLEVFEDEGFQELEFDMRGDGRKHKGYGNMVKWKCSVLMSVAEANGCSVFFMGAKCFFCGKESDVKKARTLSQKLLTEIESTSRRFSRGMGKRYANSFRWGVATEIYEILEKQSKNLKEEMRGSVSDSALMVIENKKEASQEWMESEHNDIKGSKSGTIDFDVDGYQAGRAAGEQAYHSAANERIAPH